MADDDAGPTNAKAPIARPGRYARLRFSVGRHPADLARMVAAAVVVLGSFVASRSLGLNPLELGIVTDIQGLPSWSGGVWTVLAWVGSWPGIVAVAGVTLYAGWLRLGAAVTLSAALGWVLALLIYWLAGPRPLSAGVLAIMVRGPGPQGFGFPSPHTAVAAAVVTTAVPYLRVRARQVGWVVIALVAVADVYRGEHLPLGVVAGAALGWGCGALIHVAVGAPGRRTSEPGMRLVLADAGLRVDTVIPVRRRWLRPLEYAIVTTDGQRLTMKLVRRLHRLAGPAYKARRLLASFGVELEPRLSTPRHEVEHEAYVNLLAERAGVRTLSVLLAGKLEHGPSFLITRHIPGRTLSTLGADEVADTLLDEIWSAVAALGNQRIAHHDLRASKILVDVSGHPRIVDFTVSRVGGPPAERAQDIADLLVSMASVVGVRRAIDSAQRALAVEELSGALPCLQPLALHRRLRRQLEDERFVLGELRETLAERIGCQVTRFRSPVRPATLVILLAAALAVYLLLPQVSSLPRVLQSLRHADRGWLVVAIATGFLGIVASAVTVLGSSPVRLPFWKTVAVQVAAAFTGRTTAAGIGFYAINVVYLERLGLRRSRAVGVLILNRAVTALVTAVATVLGILVIGAAAPVGQLAVPTGWPVVVAATVLVVGAIAVLLSGWGRRRVFRPAMRSVRELALDVLPTLRHPLRAGQLFGGSVLFLALSALGLAATLASFTETLPLVPVLAVYVVGSTLGQLAPTPGGLGTVEAALIAGLTAVGVHPTEAVAAVLTSRLLTFWLPVLPGILAFRLLQHHQVV